jgi:hypothetical protein
MARLQLDQVPGRDRMCSEVSASSTAIRLSGTLRDVRFVSRPGCRSCRHLRRGVSCTARLSIKPFGRASQPSTHFGVFVVIATVAKSVCEVFHICHVFACDLIAEIDAWRLSATFRLRLPDGSLSDMLNLPRVASSISPKGRENVRRTHYADILRTAVSGLASTRHRPMIRLPVRDESPDAYDRVVDVFREFIADCLADFHVRLADEIIGGREPGEVGHGLQVPDDDA